CPAETFGNLCEQKCTWCDEGQFCDHLGPPGYTGHTCQKVCPKGTSEVDCLDKSNYFHFLLSVCPKGTSGEDCLDKSNYFHFLLSVCPKGTSGVDCLDKCPKCDNVGLCDYRSGKCICLPGFRGYFCQAGN
ncbi:Hypothetical predicted protein, partial [Mytilus galloprovincialis]